MTAKQMQHLLGYLGFYAGSPDGIWGRLSREATKAFQAGYALEPDGIFGPATEKRILEVIGSGERPVERKRRKSLTGGRRSGISPGRSSAAPAGFAGASRRSLMRSWYGWRIRCGSISEPRPCPPAASGARSITKRWGACGTAITLREGRWISGFRAEARRMCWPSSERCRYITPTPSTEATSIWT